MLRLAGLSYTYPGATEPALREIELEIADGEVVGLVGAAEAGKTTLCLVASGLAPRSIGGTLAGRLLIDGEETADEPIHALVGRVGIVFQNPASQLSQAAETVFEEVAFGPLNLGFERSDVLRRTAAALRTLEIQSLAERDPRRLSGGQVQLVALAGLLAMSPAHLVLDEPLAELDPEGRRLVGDALRRLASQGRALLLAEHDTGLLAELCKRVVVLEAGRIVLTGPASEVLADERLPDWGVSPPSSVRLRRALAGAGIEAQLPL